MINFIKVLFLVLSLMSFQVATAKETHATDSIVFQVGKSRMVFNKKIVDTATLNKPDESSAKYGVWIKLNPKAAKEFEQMTGKNIGKQMSILMDGVVISAATIRSKVGGDFLVTGLTQEQADKFIKNLGF